MSKVDITVLLRAADGYDFDSNLRADAADEIDWLRALLIHISDNDHIDDDGNAHHPGYWGATIRKALKERYHAVD
jgi:hypothetical protein